MTTSMKKTLMIALGIFLTIVLAIGVVYLVRKPTLITTTPPTPKASPVQSPVVAPVFEVAVANKCETTFVVACGSSEPSPSGSATASPSSSPSTPPSAALKCMAKKMYEDDTRNRAGFYYLEKEITDTNTLSNGQIIVYNVVSKNAGGSTVPDTTITDKLSDNLSYVDGDSGCTYDSSTRIVTCTIGSLSPNSEAQRSFRTKVNVAGVASVANTAEVSSTNGQRDSCSVRIDATGKVITIATPAPTSLPVAGVFEVTAGTIGASLLLLILGGLGLLLL